METVETKKPKSSTIKKDEILKMAKEGADRPALKTPLGTALANYANAKNKSYDEAFIAAVKAVAPKWFRNRAS